MGNAYESETAEPIPTDLATAVALAKNSNFLTGVVGENSMGIIVSQAERELEFFANQVTQVEMDRYLTNM